MYLNGIRILCIDFEEKIMIKILTTLLALIPLLSAANSSDTDHHSHERSYPRKNDRWKEISS